MTVVELRTWAEGKFREFEVLLLGARGDNGLNGNIKALALELHQLDADVQATKKWAQNIWDVRRREECIGAELVGDLKVELDARLEKMEAALEKLIEKNNEDRKARYTAWAAILCAVITAGSSIIASAQTNQALQELRIVDVRAPVKGNVK